MVEEKRNILVGYVPSPITAIFLLLLRRLRRVHPNVNARSCSLGIFIGFAAFFMMEKTLRVLGGGGDHTHSHEGKGHYEKTSDEGISSAIESHNSSSSMRSRHHANAEHSNEHEAQSGEAKGTVNGPSKLSAYLNLFGDFVHNM